MGASSTRILIGDSDVVTTDLITTFMDRRFTSQRVTSIRSVAVTFTTAEDGSLLGTIIVLVVATFHVAAFGSRFISSSPV